MAITIAEIWQEMAALVMRAQTAETKLKEAETELRRLKSQQKPKRGSIAAVDGNGAAANQEESDNDANSNVQKARPRD